MPKKKHAHPAHTEASIAWMTINAEMRVIVANDMLQALTGISQAEIDKPQAPALFQRITYINRHPVPGAQLAWARALRTKRRVAVVYRLVNSADCTITARVVATPMPNGSGSVKVTFFLLPNF